MKKLLMFLVLGFLILMIIIAKGMFDPQVLGSEISRKTVLYNLNDYMDTIQGHKDCRFCHIPNNEEENKASNTPLWNKQPSSSGYPFYLKINSFAEPLTNCGSNDPDGISKLCLSCHDGIAAQNILAKKSKSESESGLSKHHPISVDYNCSYNNGLGYLRPTSWVYFSSFNSTNDNHLRDTNFTKTVASRLDEAGKVQCTSCHCMHGNSEGYLLCVSNRGSALCLVCHDK